MITIDIEGFEILDLHKVLTQMFSGYSLIEFRPLEADLKGVTIEQVNTGIEWLNNHGVNYLTAMNHLDYFTFTERKPGELGLYKFSIFDKGLLNKIKYYNVFDIDNGDVRDESSFSDLLIEVDFQYDCDAFGNPKTRTTKKYFITEEGGRKEADNSPWVKIYSPEDSIDEGMKRRRKIISKIQSDGYLLLGEAEVQAFFKRVQDEIDVFINVSNGSLGNAVSSVPPEDFGWLDQPVPDSDGNPINYTFRESILESINI